MSFVAWIRLNVRGGTLTVLWFRGLTICRPVWLVSDWFYIYTAQSRLLPGVALHRRHELPGIPLRHPSTPSPTTRLQLAA